MALVKGGLIGLELRVVPQGGATGGRGWNSMREMARPVASLVSALCQLTKLERAVLRGTKDMSVLGVLELEE